MDLSSAEKLVLERYRQSLVRGFGGKTNGDELILRPYGRRLKKVEAYADLPGFCQETRGFNPIIDEDENLEKLVSLLNGKGSNISIERRAILWYLLKVIPNSISVWKFQCVYNDLLMLNRKEIKGWNARSLARALTMFMYGYHISPPAESVGHFVRKLENDEFVSIKSMRDARRDGSAGKRAKRAAPSPSSDDE